MNKKKATPLQSSQNKHGINYVRVVALEVAL